MNQRLYAKEKLIVDLEAKFKQDIKVQGSARINTDLRVDGELRVDGLAKFMSNVKMEGLTSLPFVDSTIKVVIIQPNGQLKTVGIGVLGDGIYEFVPCMPGDVPNPHWSSGLNKIYNACDPVRVGIGTTTPDHKLHVVGVNYAQKFLGGNVGATATALLNLYCQNTSQDLMHVGIKVGGLAQEMRFIIKNDGDITIYNEGADPTITLNNGTGHALVINSNAGSKILQLEDNGMLRAREIKVDEDNWPDYVFNDDYKLMSLEDLRAFIMHNKHLPNIPSSTEVHNAGLNIGQIQTLQMEKIEELTLYTLELNEEINSLKAENELLKTELNTLKESFNELKLLLTK